MRFSALAYAEKERNDGDVWSGSGAYLVRLAEEGVSSTALVDDVSDQVFLSVVGGEDADAVGGVAQQTHVHVESHGVLRLPQVLHREKEKACGKTEVLYHYG